jgi:hypothetical protein
MAWPHDFCGLKVGLAAGAVAGTVEVCINVQRLGNKLGTELRARAERTLASVDFCIPTSVHEIGCDAVLVGAFERRHFQRVV